LIKFTTKKSKNQKLKKRNNLKLIIFWKIQRCQKLINLRKRKKLQKRLKK